VVPTAVRESPGGLQAGVYQFSTEAGGARADANRAVLVTYIVQGRIAVLNSRQVSLSVSDQGAGGSSSPVSNCTSTLKDEPTYELRVSCGSIRLVLAVQTGALAGGTASLFVAQYKGDTRGACKAYRTDPSNGTRECIEYEMRPVIKREWSVAKPISLTRQDG
jgi:hypothetical protein